MADNLSKTERSRIMSLVHGKDTKPEIMIRKSLHASGFRYQLHRADLPGKPDLCFPKYNAVIFIHGCQWHWHGCSRSRMPATNVEYWNKKIKRNIERDSVNIKKLIDMNWRVLVVWECAIKKTLIGNTCDLVSEWLLDNNMRFNKIESHGRMEIQLSNSNILTDDDF